MLAWGCLWLARLSDKMGIKGLSSNKKKTFKCRKSTKWQRSLKAEKKKQIPADSVDIENVHLFSKEKLKHKLKHPKNNIKISGKKFRRLTKRLGHSLREKSQMDIEVTDTRTKPSSINKDHDADMVDTNAETNVASSSAPSVVVPQPTSSRKKKKGGKKHKKKDSAGGANPEEKIFENDDGWEDVEMVDS